MRRKRKKMMIEMVERKDERWDEDEKLGWNNGRRSD